MDLIRQSILFFNVKLLIIAIHFHSILCWNEMVHEAIALTAMSSIEGKNLTKLIGALHGGDLVDFAYWGHNVESMIPKSRDLLMQPQHDRGCNNLNTECNNSDGLCLLNGIKFFYHRLLPNEIDNVHFKYPKNIDFTDMDSIKYLVALIADLHNPMKFGFKTDNFGNKVKVSVEYTPLFILTSSTYDLTKELENHDLNPVNKTLNEVIDSYLLETFAERHEEFWYGGWTHVNSLGIKFHEEVEMFKRSSYNAFDIWAHDTYRLFCKIYEILIPRANEERATIGEPFSLTMSSEIQIQLVQLLQQQILLAGARISIVLNHILSTKSIDSKQSAIQVNNTPQKTPEIKIKRKREQNIFSGFLINFTIFLGMALTFYVVLNARNIKRMLLKPVLHSRS